MIVMACGLSFSGTQGMSKLSKCILQLALKACSRELAVPVVLNIKPGKFFISPLGINYLQKHYPQAGFPTNGFEYADIKWRANPKFVKAVMTDSNLISGFRSDLQIDYIHKKIFPYPVCFINDVGGKEEIVYKKIKNKTQEEIDELRKKYYKALDMLSFLLDRSFLVNNADLDKVTFLLGDN